MAKAAKRISATFPSCNRLNRRKLLVGGMLTGAGASLASAMPALAAVLRTYPTETGPFKLTPEAREILALIEQRDAAGAEFDAIPRPKDEKNHSDARPEWLAARDRWHELCFPGSPLHELSKAVAKRAASEPITLDSILTLAIAARSYPSARPVLMAAVLQLGAIDGCLDMWSAEMT